MTAPPIEPAPPVSLGSRVLFFGAGLISMGVGTIITLGAALAGAIFIAIAAYVASRKNRRLTRRAAWFASVGGTVAVLAILMGIAVLADDTSKPMPASERAAQRAQATQAMPDWLKAMNPSAQRQSAVADSMANRLLENKAVVVWAGLMGAVMASAIIGTIAGSFGWGGAMLLYRGYRGRWMDSATPEAGGL